MKNFFKGAKRFLVLPLLLLVILLTPQSSNAQTKSFYWERFDVDITLQENGDMHIVERQTLNFSGEPFTYGFATIKTGDAGNNDNITDIRVSEGDFVYTESGSNAAGTFEVSRRSDEVTINWYFEPSLGSHTYTFSYTVEGGVQVGSPEEGSGDQIFWKAIPDDVLSRVEQSTVRIRLPEGVEPQRYTGTDDFLVAAYINGEEREDVNIQVSDDGRTITYATTQPIPAGQSLEVRVQFPHGQLPIETPRWQAQAQRADVIGLTILAVSLLIFIGGPLAALLLWYLRGRDPDMAVVVPDFVSEPPDDLPPAVVGSLVDERVDMQDIVSTLVDLARRGYLTMSEQKNDHVFRRTDKSDHDLRPFERQFLKDIFRNKSERSLKSLRYKFASKLPGLRKKLYEELVSQELVPRSPESVRNSYGCLAWLLLGFGFTSFIVLPALVGTEVPTAVCPAFGIGLTGIAFFIVSRYMPTKTVKGAEAAAKWNAFKQYLREIDRHENLKEAGDIFEKYLAYAIAFGLERTWIRKFARIPTTPIPRWYGPYGYGFPHRTGQAGRAESTGAPQMPTLEGMSGSLTGGLESMSSGLTRMLNSTSSILKSTRPSSSGSRSSGGFSGGFSGGSFSSGGGGSRGFG